MNIIYRIEHKENGKGPYTQYMSLKKWTDRNHGGIDTPSPAEDLLLKEFGKNNGWFDGTVNIKNLLFGFQTIECLYDWFTDKELNNLKALGFEIYQYEVNSFILGTKQVVFSKESIKSKMLLINLPTRINQRHIESEINSSVNLNSFCFLDLFI